MNYTICSQLLDWNFGLKEALPTWINQPCNEIIIFDWGHGKESAKEVVDNFSDPRIKFVQGIDPIPYNHSIARNTLVRLSSNNLIFLIDADVKILSTIPMSLINPDNFMQGCALVGPNVENTPIYEYSFSGKVLGKYKRALAGTSIFWKEHFDQINGYDERMSGWGVFDDDFYGRLTKLGKIRIDFPTNCLQHVDHSDTDRTKNFNIKNIWQSRINNIETYKNSFWDSTHKQKNINIKIYYQGSEQK